jgi:hypothetical protein
VIRPTIGKVYTIPPQPPVDEHTHRMPAGNLTIGVEYRTVDPASLQATYSGNDAHLAELFERWPGGGFTDEGVSIHVWGADDGHEYLRFDVFDDEPHYHYNHVTDPDGGEIVNNVIDFDTVALGEMLPWVLDCLRTRLAPMLVEAGGTHLVDALDTARIDAVLRDVEAMAERVRAARSR